MIPADIRNANWQEIQSNLSGDRERVYWALSNAGQITTRRLAERMGVDVLNVRPRVTELFDMGLARLVGKDGREGIYEAVPLDVARAAHEEALAVATTPKSDQILLL